VQKTAVPGKGLASVAEEIVGDLTAPVLTSFEPNEAGELLVSLDAPSDARPTQVPRVTQMLRWDRSSPASKGRECSAQTKATYRRPDVNRLVTDGADGLEVR
jgi:hypothetical protein